MSPLPMERHDKCTGSSRREFILGSVVLGAALLFPTMACAGRFHAIDGEVRINGKPAGKGALVRAMDVITTGPIGQAIVVMGKDALLIRANSEVEILGKPKAAVLTGLRMLTGGLLSVFGKAGPRQLVSPLMTVGIRGTGIYMEASAERTYLCTCYGEVEITDQKRKEKRLVLAGYHTPTLVHAETQEGPMMEKAAFINHTDEELVMLEKLVGRVPPFRR